MEMCFVYVLGCREFKGKTRTYVGWTTDLERRTKEHNSGTGARSTRGRTWHLLYAEMYTNRREAMRREWNLKRDTNMRNEIRRCMI